MRKYFVITLLLLLLPKPVLAMEFTPPSAPDTVQEYMPQHSSTFTEDFLYILQKVIPIMLPSLSEAVRLCMSVFGICLFVSLLKDFSSLSARTVGLVGTLCVSTTLLFPSNSLIHIGITTVENISEYGKLLIPVLTASLAAEGGSISSVTLYTGTVIFNTVLTVAIKKLLIPMLYAYIAVSVAKSFLNEATLDGIHKFTKWLMTWTLKIAIYAFTGYLGITSVIVGKVDAAAIKAAKLAISGVVPVIGNVIADASETILVSASVMKNAAGTYGLLVIIAIWIAPFIKIGLQYIILKITGAVCDMFGNKQIVTLINDISTAMGILVAVIGTISLLFLVSIVCFMKGVG